MASVGGAIRAGAAYVELSTDNKKLTSGLAAAASQVKQFGAGIATAGAAVGGLGAAILTPLLGAAKVFADVGSEMYDMSQRTGIAVENLSSLGFAASQSGTSLGAVEVAMKKLGQVITKADEDGTKANETLEKLGINLGDIKSLSPDEQFRQVAKALSKIQDPAKRGTAAIAIFGKQGKALIPMLNDLEALEEQAKALGLVMSTEDAEAADALGDSLGALWAQVKMVTFQVGGALAPALTDLLEPLAGVLAGVIDWVKQNKAMIVTAAKVGGVLIGVGAALVAVGGTIAAVGSAIGVVAAPLATLSAVFGVILTPIGLLVTALVGVGIALVALVAPGETLGEKFAWLWDQIVKGAMVVLDTVITVVAGVIVAFQQWENTFALVQATAELAFVKITEDLKLFWDNLKSIANWLGGAFLAAWTAAFQSIAAVMFNFGGSFQRFWEAVMKKMKNPLAKFEFNVAKEMGNIAAGIKPIALPALELKDRDKTELEKDLEEFIADVAGGMGADIEDVAAKIKAALFGEGGVLGGKKGTGIADAFSTSAGKAEAIGTFSAAAVRAGALGAKDPTKELTSRLDKLIVVGESTAKAVEKLNVGVV